VGGRLGGGGGITGKERVVPKKKRKNHISLWPKDAAATRYLNSSKTKNRRTEFFAMKRKRGISLLTNNPM